MASKFAVVGLFALVLTLVVFGFNDADLVVQNLFFDAATSSWMVSKQAPLERLVFYTGPKALIICFGIACVVALIASPRWPWAARRRRALLIVVLSLIIVPSLVGGLKTATNVACPANLETYGGTLPHVPLFDAYPPDDRPEKTQRCFPAGHASGGFALLSLVVLFTERRRQYQAAGFAILVGTIMGVYKMAIGDHFLSHVLVTFELAVIVVVGLTSAVRRFVPARFDRQE